MRVIARLRQLAKPPKSGLHFKIKSLIAASPFINSLYIEARWRLCWRLIRILLWLIRRLGFALERGAMVYKWVNDRDGSFDHWFMIDGRARDLEWDFLLCGYWPLIWFILSDSKLLLGKARRRHWEAIRNRSGEYYCGRPISHVRERCHEKSAALMECLR